MPTTNSLGPKRASLQKYSTNVAPMRGAYANARKYCPICTQRLGCRCFI
jgi:hypothetical protein